MWLEGYSFFFYTPRTDDDDTDDSGGHLFFCGCGVSIVEVVAQLEDFSIFSFELSVFQVYFIIFAETKVA